MSDQADGEQRVLAIVERGYRGALDKQFFDELYLATELHRQLGGLDILLRGTAVGYALDAPPPPALRIGARTLDTLTDPRAGLRSLLEAGVGVWVEEPALTALGSPRPPLAGIRLARDGEVAARWAEYRMVFFL
ncbi:hypothetical protein BFF78_09790 [Streptomyces fodineus]|uniref:Uncharacterized protein n=1 Tax=Streptomyces fodineus TaxID=1904616 RepID=A0A1D7Y6U7_9ACTN|nr:hypothetical protein [Streptomyces fodineus]AOR31291.1 hypothetical protein BFF78_09790 [Streptomyces fodineus]